MQYFTIALAGAGFFIAVAALVVAWQAKRLASPERLSRLEGMVHEKSEPEVIEKMRKDIAALQKHADSLDNTAEKTDRRLDTAIQKIGLCRFNSSEQVGGELSFSLTMLDARRHGFILTSQTDLEKTRLFIRGIVGGKSRTELLEHEKTSLQQALQSQG
ncbi:MAG: DUF4446 family protein [Armatimonadota bacterium]